MVKDSSSLSLNKREKSWWSTWCTFKPSEPPYECPYSGSKCSVKGNITSLVEHLTDDHKVLETLYDSQPYDVFEFGHDYIQSHSGDMDHPPGMCIVFNYYKRQFCYHIEAILFGMTPCYIVFLRFMGEETESKKFRYSLEISKNGRKLTWQGVPRSIRESHHKVRDTQDGLLIPHNLLLLFLEESEQGLKLRLEGRIWREYY
nr:E3 ubiquitin-protein ligase SINAT2 [Tanacetum cinerariifolium]